MMDFFKIRKFRKAHKPNQELNTADHPVSQPEQPQHENGDDSYKSVSTDATAEVDDGFISNEVNMRLQELTRNSFMGLVPEESCVGEVKGEEEGETSLSEWRDTDEQNQYPSWFGFDALYDKYCEQMLYFDRMSVQQLKEAGSLGIGSLVPSTPSRRSTSKKFASSLRCLYLKRNEEPEDETECLQHPGDDPYHDLEIVYVAQACLTWEALHCQYTQLSQKISSHIQNSVCYNQSAQEFQQFEVLLQRFVENEPFEQGVRAEIFARARHSWPRLLQVPKVQGSDKVDGEDESDLVVLAPDLLRLIETSILTFHLFLKMDKKKASGALHIFGGQIQFVTPLQQVQSALEKKKMRLKEMRKRKKGWKNKSWPSTNEDVELLLGLIDIKILSRVLRMVRITKETLIWSEDKMKKIGFFEGKLQRDHSPILFPCS